MPYDEKPLFQERMQALLPDEKDFKQFQACIHTATSYKSIRCNTLKINPDELKKRLEKRGWKIHQPYKEYPEIMQITSELKPGELGKTKEHLLGYYYVQEITSMMPIIALAPKPNEIILDLCASPGSKTTYASALMKNSGTMIANDLNIGRIVILSSNLERQGATNTIITRHDGVILCEKLKKLNFKFDKILIDAPCSGEGNLRCNPKTFIMWNINVIKRLRATQKKLLESAIQLLKQDGEIVYSTCTHSPEENEEVLDFVLKQNPNLKVQEIKLPLKSRQGITNWQNQTFSSQLKKAHRIYPHDNDLEGFFLCKMKLK